MGMRGMLGRRVLGLAICAAWLGGCAPGGPGARNVPAGPAECVALFQQFDALERIRSSVIGRNDDRTVDSVLLRQGQRLQFERCFTSRDDLEAGNLDLAERDGAIAAHGTRIAPIAVHAGVVSNMADDRRMKAHFQTLGFQARSVGHAALGRRIYLGPVGTDAELARAMEAARRAGFASPYPARF